MPIAKRWSKFTLANVQRVPDKPGAYELANKDRRIINTGGSNKSVRARLLSHLGTNKYPTAAWFRYKLAGWFEKGTTVEANLSEKFVQKHGRKPRYTKRSPRKPKPFLFL
jgi:excinuclease UvrABC nuclease subunit